MRRRSVSLLLAVASCAIAAVAAGQVTAPYFEINGGVADKEQVVGGGNFIPAGALETDSAVVSGVPTPVTVILRDPGYDGAPRQVCVDYIGTDAAFENRFFVSGTAINWCNKASCTDPTATPVGAGNKTWTAPFTASACFQMNVGQQVPFGFVSDVTNQGGNGTHAVGNGQAVAGAHWGAFPYPFIFAPPFPAGSAVIGIGLADGAWVPGDDDHQDFAVRFTVQGVPIPPVVQVPTLGQWGLALLVLGVALLGVRRLRHMRS